jgi:sirohydrochlorin cobaltochelatase
MLVAGVHFIEDLSEGEDSWKGALEEAGLGVAVESQGTGTREAVVRIFIDHIREALDIIPGSEGQAAEIIRDWPQKVPEAISPCWRGFAS